MQVPRFVTFWGYRHLEFWARRPRRVVPYRASGKHPLHASVFVCGAAAARTGAPVTDGWFAEEPVAA